MIKTDKKGFSTRNRLKSFVYAFRGISYLIKTQHNAWIHSAFALLAIVLGFLLSVNPSEWCLIILCIGLVLAAEAFNTAIEMLCDARFPEYDKRAELIKDTAAGAVLLVSIASAIIGIIIFLPKIILLLM